MRRDGRRVDEHRFGGEQLDLQPVAGLHGGQGLVRRHLGLEAYPLEQGPEEL